MLRLATLAFAFALAFAARSFAADSVQINFSGNDFRDSTNTGLGHGQLVLLLANVGTSSTAGAGFTPLGPGSLSIGSILNGSYQILGRASIDAGFGTSASTGSTTVDLVSATFPNLSTGDQLAVVWFPTLSFSSGFSLTNGTSYGLFTVNSSITWQVPAAGSTISLTVPDGQIASLTAIPEPSTYAVLAGLAILGVAVCRRGQKIAPAV